MEYYIIGVVILALFLAFTPIPHVAKKSEYSVVKTRRKYKLYINKFFFTFPLLSRVVTRLPIDEIEISQNYEQVVYTLKYKINDFYSFISIANQPLEMMKTIFMLGVVILEKKGIKDIIPELKHTIIEQLGNKDTITIISIEKHDASVSMNNV